MKKYYKKLLFIYLFSLQFITNVSAKSEFDLWDPFIVKKFAGADVVCEGNFGAFLKQMFHLIKFAVPILIIGLGIMDFVKALSAQKQEELNKAATKLVKRLIIGAVIFVLPTIVDYLLSIAGITSSTCGW